MEGDTSIRPIVRSLVWGFMYTRLDIRLSVTIEFPLDFSSGKVWISAPSAAIHCCYTGALLMWSEGKETFYNIVINFQSLICSWAVMVSHPHVSWYRKVRRGWSKSLAPAEQIPCKSPITCPWGQTPGLTSKLKQYPEPLLCWFLLGFVWAI